MQEWDNYIDESVSEAMRENIPPKERNQLAHDLGYSPEYVAKVMNRERKNADIHKALKFLLQTKLTNSEQKTVQ